MKRLNYMRINIGLLVTLIVLFIMPAGVQAQSDDGLVAKWHFDEGSGSVLKDSSGNGNDGVIYGATWVDGKYGSALSFDGVDDYVSVIGPVGTFSDLTVETWVRVNGYKDYGKIIDFGGDSGIGRRFTLQVESNSIGFSLDGSPSGKASWASKPYEWINVVGVWNKSSFIRLYVNGELKVENTLAPTIDSLSIKPSHSHIIGRRITSLDYFNGIIDEVKIYNNALTAEEIKEHYESGPTALSLTKTASPQSIKRGQTATITLTVKNTGSTEISDIEIADTIPSYLTFIDGETSKRYDSLAPKDTRQISYTLQFNDAGTFNFEPAIATYADYKGNYNTVKSKTASIEVIRSIIENSAPTPKPTNGNVQSASVHLHGEKTDVVMGEDILLKLAAVNLITKPTMHVQVIITPPSGMSVTSSEFVQSGAGLFTASYEIEPGVGRDIEVRMRSNQVGDFVVNGRIVYYFGDDMDNAEDHTLTLPITVRAGAEPTDSSSESKESSTPGFGLVIAFMGLAAAGMVRGKIK